MIQSKMLVLSTSKDLQWRRHLYIRQAATGLPPEKPRSCEVHFIKRSWFSCTQKKGNNPKRPLSISQIRGKLRCLGVQIQNGMSKNIKHIFVINVCLITFLQLLTCCFSFRDFCGVSTVSDSCEFGPAVTES